MAIPQQEVMVNFSPLLTEKKFGLIILLYQCVNKDQEKKYSKTDSLINKA
jgi:hypothetical protein